MNRTAVLTKMQRAYLEDIIRMGRLQQGWGGRNSTRVVLRLEWLGLVRVRMWPQPGNRADRWEASPLVQEVPERLEQVGSKWQVVA